MPEPQVVSIASGSLRASVSSLGAELVRLHTASGVELLWDGNPAVWAGHSPLLFPIVGQVKDDRITVGGTAYPLSRHGFARTSTFELAEAQPSACRWRLRRNRQTRPLSLRVRLDVAYAIEEVASPSRHRRQRGDGPMPASFEFHPAFRWPCSPACRATGTSPLRETRPRCPARQRPAGRHLRITRAGRPAGARGFTVRARCLIWDRRDRLTYGGQRAGAATRLSGDAVPRHLDQTGRRLRLPRALAGFPAGRIRWRTGGKARIVPIPPGKGGCSSLRDGCLATIRALKITVRRATDETAGVGTVCA